MECLSPKQAQLLPCTVVLYDNGGTIQRAGCPVTGCQIKMTSRSRTSRQMASSMRGNVSLCIIPPLDEQEICMILIFLTNVIIIEKHTFLSESENLLPWMKKCHDKISPTHYHYSKIPHFIGVLQGGLRKGLFRKTTRIIMLAIIDTQIFLISLACSMGDLKMGLFSETPKTIMLSIIITPIFPISLACSRGVSERACLEKRPK